MHPQIGAVPAYVVGWALAIALGGGGIVWLLRRAGLPVWQVGVVVGSLVASVFIGSKLLYLLESWSQWFGNRGAFTAAVYSAHMRLPGGFLLMVAVTPAVARLIGVRSLWLVDTFIPAVGLSVVGIRTGCFLEGCCYGTPSSLPWAVSFPALSDVYWWQVQQGLIPLDAKASAPVHPLQVYFALAGLLIFLGLLSYQRRKRYDGELLVLFALTFLWSTWTLELLRARSHDFTREFTLLAAVAVGIAALVIEWRLRASERMASASARAAVTS